MCQSQSLRVRHAARRGLRRGRALLGLEEWTEAAGAFKRGLVLDPADPALADGLARAEEGAAARRLEVLRLGSAAAGISPGELFSGGEGAREGRADYGVGG